MFSLATLRSLYLTCRDKIAAGEEVIDQSSKDIEYCGFVYKYWNLTKHLLKFLHTPHKAFITYPEIYLILA